MITLRELYDSLEGLCEAASGTGHPKAVLGTLAMARDTARRAVLQAECTHPAGRQKGRSAPRAAAKIVTCLDCGRQTIETTAANPPAA